MSFFRSIKVRVWFRFEVVVMAMLAFTYVFLIALFPSFYSWMKTYELEEAFVKIRANWSSENIYNVFAGYNDYRLIVFNNFFICLVGNVRSSDKVTKLSVLNSRNKS